MMMMADEKCFFEYGWIDCIASWWILFFAYTTFGAIVLTPECRAYTEGIDRHLDVQYMRLRWLHIIKLFYRASAVTLYRLEWVVGHWVRSQPVHVYVA